MSKKSKVYSWDELKLKGDTEEEQIRTRTIFENLQQKALEGKDMIEREKDFFCTCLKLSDWDDGAPSEYEVCGNFIFKELYLTYFSSNLHAENFYKANKGKLYIVPEQEIIKDFKFLQRESNRWLRKIEKQNHEDQILHILAAETRKDLKAHKANSGTLFFQKQKKDYALQKDKLILHSKFICLLVKQVSENYSVEDFKFNFLEENIEIDIHSLIHIINRHYAAMIKDNPAKSYHIEDFEPEFIHIKLKDIFFRIDSKKILKKENINKIAFIFKGTVYRVWMQKREKHLKDIGKYFFYRVETFYPIEDTSELTDINTNFELHKIDEELSIYVNK